MTIEASLDRIAAALEKIAASADAPAPAPSTATTESAPASSAGAASPKATRQKKPAAASPIVKEEPAALTGGDMFGEETSEAPKDTPATVTESSAPTAKASSKATALTADNVRAALVDLQTKAGGRDAVNALLAKHTKNGTSTLSGLNDQQERFKAVIDEAKALVAAAAK